MVDDLNVSRWLGPGFGTQPDGVPETATQDLAAEFGHAQADQADEAGGTLRTPAGPAGRVMDHRGRQGQQGGILDPGGGGQHPASGDRQDQPVACHPLRVGPPTTQNDGRLSLSEPSP